MLSVAANMKKKIKLRSIEDASLIRKFTVLFVIMSILPFAAAAYFIVQYVRNQGVDLQESTLSLIIFLLGCGVLAGFYGMRKSILKIQALTKQATQTLLKEGKVELDLDTESEESEIAQLTRTFRDVTKNLEDNIKRLEGSKRTMQYVLSKLATGISSSHSIDAFLDLIVEITANALDARVGVLMVLDEEKQELYIKSAYGLEEQFRDLRLSVGEEGPGWVAKNRKPLLVPALHKAEPERDDPFSPPMLCAPMLFQDRLIGVLVVAGKIQGVHFGEDELLIVSNLASQTAVAIENERLNEDAEKTYLETVSALAMAVEARDPYSRGHSDRVSQYAVKIAEKLGLEPELIQDIKDAAELHDVGKIGIGDDILKKNSPLSDEEMQIMRKHPLIGEGIVKPVRSLSRLCSIIRHHHEFLDGTGYPDRLKGEQIPLGARVLLVADSFDAIVTDRPYRKALTIEAAKEEIKKYAGIYYDKKVAETFLSIV